MPRYQAAPHVRAAGARSRAMAEAMFNQPGPSIPGPAEAQLGGGIPPRPAGPAPRWLPRAPNPANVPRPLRYIHDLGQGIQHLFQGAPPPAQAPQVQAEQVPGAQVPPGQAPAEGAPRLGWGQRLQRAGQQFLQPGGLHNLLGANPGLAQAALQAAAQGNQQAQNLLNQAGIGPEFANNPQFLPLRGQRVPGIYLEEMPANIRVQQEIAMENARRARRREPELGHDFPIYVREGNQYRRYHQSHWGQPGVYGDAPFWDNLFNPGGLLGQPAGEGGGPAGQQGAGQPLRQQDPNIYQPRFTGPQEAAIYGSLGNALWQNIRGPQQPFGPVAAAAQQRFQQQTVPSIMERLTALGNERGSGAQQVLGAAGRDLQTQLGGLESAHNLQAQEQHNLNVQRLLSTGLTPLYENIYQPPPPPPQQPAPQMGAGQLFANNLLGAAARAIPVAAAGYFGGPAAATAVGAGMGGLANPNEFR